MSAKTLCSSCLRALQRQAPPHSLTPTSRLPKQRHASQATQKSPQATRPHRTDKVAPATQLPNAGPSPTSKDASSTAKGSSSTSSMVQNLKGQAPGFTETYVAYGVCELLVKECARVADYTVPQAPNADEELPKNEKNEDIGVGTGWWYEELGLAPTFQSWAQVTFLHMWCLTVRLRSFPKPSATTWHQHLTDQFFYLAEDKMVMQHRLHSRAIRTRYLKDLFHQWRGLTAAYDVGLVKGDALLASALWRNLCAGNLNVDVEKLAQVVAYTRSILYNLERIEDYVVGRGDIVFGDPAGEEKLVKQRSKLMDVKFKESELDSTGETDS